MVKINEPVVKAEVKRRGWSELRLADEMGVSLNTAKNLLAGGPVGHSTQVALFNALGGRIPFKKLFVVTPGESAEATAKVTEGVA